MQSYCARCTQSAVFGMKLSTLALLCVLLSATSCSADKGAQTGLRVAAGPQPVNPRPWLVGLTAVVCFLFIVFAILIIHRLLRKRRENEEKCGYDNKAVMLHEDENRQTSL